MVKCAEIPEAGLVADLRNLGLSDGEIESLAVAVSKEAVALGISREEIMRGITIYLMGALWPPILDMAEILSPSEGGKGQ